MEVGPGFHPAIATLQFTLYTVWLIFLSWKLSDMIPGTVAPIRAALCVTIGVAISWTPVLLRGVFAGNRGAGDPLTLDYLVVQIGAPLIAFAWLWWWLDRTRPDDQDFAKIFE